MSDTGDRSALDPASRILHVVEEPDGAVGEAARAAVLGQLAAGFPVGIAARRSVRDSIAASVDDPAFVRIDTGHRAGPRPGDLSRAYTLHRYYRHVDVVHAHGLHSAALAGLALTGLPERLRPTIVSTIGRFDESNAGERAAAGVVARTSAAVLGTTDVVCEAFEDDVAFVERARLPRADVDEDYEVRRGRAEIRAEIGVPAGAVMIAVPAELIDHTALTTILDAAVRLPRHRADRRWRFVLTGSGRLRSVIDEEFASVRQEIIRADGPATVDVVAGAEITIATERMSAITPEGIMQLGRPAIFVGSERGARIFGDTARIVAADDTEGLVDAISLMSDDPAGRIRAGAAGRRRVDDVSEVGLIAADLLDVYAAARAAVR